MFRLALVLAMLAAPAAEAADGTGDLDFSKLNPQQMTWLTNRIGLLAFEEALITHCGQGDDFVARAKRAVRACVTADALRRTESIFRNAQKVQARFIASYGPKWKCSGPVVINNKPFPDEAVVVKSSKQDLDYVVGEMADMCQKCKTTIWAAFCH